MSFFFELIFLSARTYACCGHFFLLLFNQWYLPNNIFLEISFPWLNQCLLPSLLLLTWQLTVLGWWFVYAAHKPAVIVRCRISVRNISPVQSNAFVTAHFNGHHLVFERPGFAPPHHSITLDPKQMRRGLAYFGILAVGKPMMAVCCSAAGFHTLYWETTVCLCLLAWASVLECWPRALSSSQL